MNFKRTTTTEERATGTETLSIQKYFIQRVDETYGISSLGRPIVAKRDAIL